jgi:Dolichyl-phosphate-mannose-protein mannosyltransferase
VQQFPETYPARLQRSFTAVYAALEVPRVARCTVIVLLVVHSALLAYSAYVHSPTLNEPGHLVAGLSHWKFGRFELYRVNPPLVRMIAALPVMAVGYNEDWSGFYEGPGARPEIAMGESLVRANGERTFFLFMIARWACIPFSWIGALVCYLWARDLYGRPSGVFACAIWCFEPNILAHATLITADAGATALGLAATYTFWRWLKKPTWTQAAWTGVILGLAELAKTTWILFYPLWPFMWLFYRLLPSPTGRGQVEGTLMTPRDWLREAGMWAVRMVIGLYVLNLGYGFEGSFTQLKDFHFVSDLFTGRELRVESRRSDNPQSANPNPQPRGPQPPSASASQLVPSASPTNRFANSWLGYVLAPFAKNYLLGIDIQQKDFEHYGRPSYLHGVWQDHGWWYYYLYACAIKVPLGLWLLGLFVLVSRIRGLISKHVAGEAIGIPRVFGERFDKGPRSLSPTANPLLTTNYKRITPALRDEFILLFPGFTIFAIVSSETGFSEHMRYVLPALPYFFIWTSSVFELKCLTDLPGGVDCNSFGLPWKFPKMAPLFMAACGVLATWLVASSFWLYPHNLMYFNEAIGGPANGYKHLRGSNLDWGQNQRYSNLVYWSEAAK